MSVDLRLKHDRSLRELAADMFERGFGRKSAADVLGIPEKAVRKWQQTYRAVGRDGLLNMGKKHARYDFETKVAAASVFVNKEIDISLCRFSTLRWQAPTHLPS